MDPLFRDKAARRSLNKTVIDTLIKNEFYTEAAIAAMLDEDITTLGLVLGSRRVLEQWRSDLKFSNQGFTITEQPEVFTIPLKDVVCRENGEVSMECEVSKSGRKLEWFKDGMDVPIDARIELKVDGCSHKLVIHNVQLDDAAQFMVKIGDQESQARLCVEELPCQIEKSLQDLEPMETETITLAIEITKPRKVTWLRNGQNISTDDRTRVMSDDTGLKHTLTLTSIRPDEGGVFTVQIDDNQYGVLNTSATVTVIELPCQIEKSLQDLEPMETDTITLAIEITKPRKVTWLRNGQNISTDDRTNSTVIADDTGLKHTLTLTSIRPDEGGVFTVQIDDNQYEVLNTSATVTVIELVDLETAQNELNMSEDAVQAMRRYVKEHGVDKLQLEIDTKLNLYKQCDVHIAITGRTGCGKSTLINTLRNIGGTHQFAAKAKVGTTQTTMARTPYRFPKLPNVIIWDLPGVGTKDFGRGEYAELMQFNTYDGFIILTETRFTEDDASLVKEIVKRNKPFYLIRTKIDNDIRNHEGESKQPTHDMLDAIKSSIITELENYNLPSSKVYLISGKLDHKTQLDMPDFLRDLHNQTPEKNKEVLLKAIVASSKEIIEDKRKDLENRLENVVVSAILNNKNYQTVLQKEVKLYTESLGITKQDLEDIDTNELDGKFKRIIEELDELLKPIGWFGRIMNFFSGWITKRDLKTRSNNANLAKDILKTSLEKGVDLAIGVLEQRSNNQTTINSTTV